MTKAVHRRAIPEAYAGWLDLDARTAMYADQEIKSCEATTLRISNQTHSVNSAWAEGMAKQLSVRLHAANLVREALSKRYS